MFDKALSAVEQFHMFSMGDTVVAGVSGGADSMAMLHFLLSVKDKYSLKIIVAHVNHGLRGDEAKRDENFVRDFCAQRGIPLEVLQADVNALAKISGESTEECGRRIRYEFFSKVCSGAKIVTAHTASDNAETVLFNLSRGASLKGICGIPPVRDNIVRPLIYCTRTDIEKYCADNCIDYVTDSTNLTLDYSRNKIRHIVVPALSEINGSFEANVSRLSQNARLDEDCLQTATQELLERAFDKDGYLVDVILKAHWALQQRAVHALLKKHCPEKADSKTVSLVLDMLSAGGKIQLSQELFVSCDKTEFKFLKEEESFPEWIFEVEKDFQKTVQIKDKNINFSCINKKVFIDTQKIHKQILDYCIDYDTIIGNVCIGSRQEGDKITLQRRNCTKTLKKLFNEAHVLPQSRNAVAVLRDDKGVMWVERCRVTKDTEKFLIINIGGKFNEK